MTLAGLNLLSVSILGKKCVSEKVSVELQGCLTSGARLVPPCIHSSYSSLCGPEPGQHLQGGARLA